MEGFFYCFIENDEKVASSEKHTQFKAKVQKSYPIYNQNGRKTICIPFGAVHTYLTHVREYPSESNCSYLAGSRFTHCVAQEDRVFIPHNKISIGQC